MSTLYTFNPDTDFARAADSVNYTVRKNVIALRKKMCLLPAIFADYNDSVLVVDNLENEELQSSPFYKIAKDKKINIISLSNYSNYVEDIESFARIMPWGWDRHISNLFHTIGVKTSLLPDDKQLTNLKRLSSREFAIEFNNLLKKQVPNIKITPAQYFTDIDSVMDFCKFNIENGKEVWLKQLWSSSGRGILRSDDSSFEKIGQWVKGALRKQGGVTAEIFCDKILDFASEWTTVNNKIEFIGFSMFNSSARGKYHGNYLFSQNEIINSIKSATTDCLSEIINAQHEIIESEILPFYKGDLGIDMMIRSDHTINACVEINMRTTMGHAALKARKYFPKSSHFPPAF